ncbi:MAG: glutamate-1-semialdehyde 2,1-aminomutase [Myxococcota bacterium]
MSDAVSRALHEKALQVMPGGVNSPVRAFQSVGGSPVYIQSASGPWLKGADGRRYVDYIGSWGPMILGHARAEVVEAICEAAQQSSSFGAPTQGEVALAEKIRDFVPSMQMVRLTSSGTEAVMGALRVARGYTGRDLVVKCIGAYHGGADYLLVKAGSGAATLGAPDSAGVPKAIASTTSLVHYNDIEGIQQLFKARGRDVAAVIVEPVAGNMGCVAPELEWLEELRSLTEEYDSLLVFDEVMTGFRVARGGAQERFGLTPDLTCLGKILGGGLPVGAYGGRRDVMSMVAPSGPVYQAGTLSGNPLAVAAGIRTLELLDEEGFYERLESCAQTVASILAEASKRSSAQVQIQRVGAMLTAFFSPEPVRSWREADRCDRDAFGRWHRSMLERGVYWPPSQFEAAFPSITHEGPCLEVTEQAAREAFAAL